MAKIIYNGAHAGFLTVEGYTFQKGINDVNDTVLNHLHTQWMLKNKHFILIPETPVTVDVVAQTERVVKVAVTTSNYLAAPKLPTQTQAEYEALEAAKNAKTAELAAKKEAAAQVIADAAAKKAAAAAKEAAAAKDTTKK